MSKIDESLFSPEQTQALANAYGECPQCQHTLVVKFSQKRSFIGCSAYPQCEYIADNHQDSDSVIKVMEGTSCPLCASELAIKKGKYGMFIGCSDFPGCYHMQPIKEQTATAVTCPDCKQGHYIERLSKQGKRFWACSRYPSCKHISNSAPQ